MSQLINISYTSMYLLRIFILTSTLLNKRDYAARRTVRLEYMKNIIWHRNIYCQPSLFAKPDVVIHNLWISRTEVQGNSARVELQTKLASAQAATKSAN